VDALIVDKCMDVADVEGLKCGSPMSLICICVLLGGCLTSTRSRLERAAVLAGEGTMVFV
jgi:hypothetical protein